MLSLLLLFAAATATIVLGCIVFFQSNRQTINTNFAILSLSVAGWIISNALFGAVSEEEIRFAIGLVSYGFGMFLALSFFLFCVDVSGHRYEKGMMLVAKIIGVVVAVVSMIPGVVAYGVEGLSMQTNIISLTVYGIVLLAFLGTGLRALVISARSAENQLQRSRVKTVLSGLTIAVVIGVLCNLILPLSNNYSFVQFGPLGSVALVVACAYSMIRHGLFDIKLAAVRSVTYLLSLLALAALYYSAAYIISILIFREDITSTFTISPYNIILALVLAFIFQPIKHFFDKATDKVFYSDRYDSEAFYSRLSEILTTESTDLRRFLAQISNEIGTTMRSEVAFMQVQWGHHSVTAGDKGRKTFSDVEIEEIRLHALEHQVDVIAAKSMPEEDRIRMLLEEHDIAITVPLLQRNTVFGYLFLGERRSSDYTDRDKKVLETISNELVVAVQNALSLQEIKDFNVHLQQRIEAATSELVASNEKLKRLDAAKDEFVSVASHQLRTPLTSVKGYISMVLEGDAGKITPMQRQLLGEAFISSERMVHLIGDFLNVSRIQTGKFVLDKSLVNLADLVSEEVDGLKVTAKARSLTLKYRKPARIPALYIDGGKIHQVIMNFIDNAIYYSPEDTVITVKLSQEGGYVVFTVHDNGIGVPKSEQDQLFTKFFRATNARRQRPDGTGIGLYLAKKVIDSHEGMMVFESSEGKGSTFGFRLPIKKLSQKPSDESSH